MAIVILTNIGGDGRAPQEQVTRVDLSVNDPRPVAEAIRILEINCACAITYEDPLYAHPSTIEDVATKVRRDLDKYKPGEAPPVFIPRGGALAVSYDAKPGRKIPVDIEKTVQAIVDANAANSTASRFRVESAGKVIHVIPTAFKNSAGVLSPYEPVLDALISIPAEDRSGLDTLGAICASVSQATETHVVMGTIPLNRLNQHRDVQGATNQKARDVLMQLLERTAPGATVSWDLFYDPMMKRYVLNIHVVN